MKKQYFFKQFHIVAGFGNAARESVLVPTVDVDFDAIENGLPQGAKIDHATVQTVVTGEYFIVYGVFHQPSAALMEASAAVETKVTEATTTVAEDVLGQSETTPSSN